MVNMYRGFGHQGVSQHQSIFSNSGTNYGIQINNGHSELGLSKGDMLRALLSKRLAGRNTQSDQIDIRHHWQGETSAFDPESSMSSPSINKPTMGAEECDAQTTKELECASAMLKHMGKSLKENPISFKSMTFDLTDKEKLVVERDKGDLTFKHGKAEYVIDGKAGAVDAKLKQTKDENGNAVTNGKTTTLKQFATKTMTQIGGKDCPDLKGYIDGVCKELPTQVTIQQGIGLDSTTQPTLPPLNDGMPSPPAQPTQQTGGGGSTNQNGNGNGSTNNDGDGNANTQTNGSTNQNGNGNGSTNNDGDGNANTQTNGSTNQNGNGNGSTNNDGDGNANTQTNGSTGQTSAVDPSEDNDGTTDAGTRVQRHETFKERPCKLNNGNTGVMREMHVRVGPNPDGTVTYGIHRYDCKVDPTQQDPKKPTNGPTGTNGPLPSTPAAPKRVNGPTGTDEPLPSTPAAPKRVNGPTGTDEPLPSTPADPPPATVTDGPDDLQELANLTNPQGSPPKNNDIYLPLVTSSPKSHKVYLPGLNISTKKPDPYAGTEKF